MSHSARSIPELLEEISAQQKRIRELEQLESGRKQAMTQRRNRGSAGRPVLSKAGHERWLGQNAQLIVEEGHVTGFQTVARDITDRRRMEEELNRGRSYWIFYLQWRQDLGMAQMEMDYRQEYIT